MWPGETICNMFLFEMKAISEIIRIIYVHLTFNQFLLRVECMNASLASALEVKQCCESFQ